MKRSRVAVTVALTLVGAIAAGTTLASGEPARPGRVVDAPLVSALSAQPPTELSASARDVLSSPAVLAYRPRLSEARTVAAPRSGGDWTLVPTQDGGACMIVGSHAAGCAPQNAITTGRFGLIVIRESPEQREGEERARITAAQRAAEGDESAAAVVVSLGPGGGEATRYGVVPDGIASVESVGADGRALGRADVTHNTYELALGQEGQATSVRFWREDGTLAFTWDVH